MAEIGHRGGDLLTPGDGAEWNETEAAQAGRRGGRPAQGSGSTTGGQARPSSHIRPPVQAPASRKSSRSRVWSLARERPAVPEMSWLRITAGPEKPPGTSGGTMLAATPGQNRFLPSCLGEPLRPQGQCSDTLAGDLSSTGPSAMRVLSTAGLLLGLLTLPACVCTEKFTVCKVDAGDLPGPAAPLPSDFEQLPAAGVRTILDMQAFRPQGSEQEASGLGARHRLPQLSGLALARRHRGDRERTAACCARRITRSTSTATPAGIAPVWWWACTGSVARAGSPRPPTTK